jgi:TIGR03009 family protein
LERKDKENPMFRSVPIVSLAGLMLLASLGGAQEPANLDSVLRAWEKATRDVKSVSCVLERESDDKALQTKVTSKGMAMFLRAKGPDDQNRFRFELTDVGDPKAAQKFISAGNVLYNYEPASKVVRIFDLAKFHSAVLDRIALLSFIFEMDAEQSKARYQMDLIKPVTPDMHYHYIRVRPKRDFDRRNLFTEARISLSRTNNLPTQIWYHEPSGKEITWNFRNMEVDSDKIVTRHFNPEVPDGWRLERPSSTR